MSRITQLIVLIHSLLVGFVISSIFSGTYSEIMHYWYLFILFDFPAFALGYLSMPIIGGVLNVIAELFPSSSPLSDVRNFWQPVYTFGLLGTIQWIYLPGLIRRSANKYEQWLKGN